MLYFLNNKAFFKIIPYDNIRGTYTCHKQDMTKEFFLLLISVVQ